MILSKISITQNVLLNWYSSMKKKLRKIWMIFDIENWLWNSNIGTFWQLVINPKLKIQSFSLSILILSNFVSPIWKLHNPYCHILHSSSSFNTLTKVSGFVLSIFGKFAYLEKRKAWGLRKGFIKYWALFLHENRQ